MPEANVLYSVTAAVVAGLVVWVAVVLKSAKEPWARETPKALRADDVPLEGASPSADAESVKSEPAAAAKADAKEEAKADAKEEAKADAKEEAKADAKEEAAKDEAAADAKEEAKADAK